MPDVYVRLREGGLNDGEPIPADGTVTLTPVRVVDPEALVTNATTVLRVAGGAADPVSVSAGRWRVDARSRSWQRSWTVDLEDDAEPVNLALLMPVDPASPLPWMPTEADMVEAAALSKSARALAGLAEDLRSYPLLSESRGDGSATISGWLSSTRDTGVVHIRSIPKGANTGEHWSVNPLASMQGRAVTSLDVVGGKLYSGFGDWGANGDRVGVVSHDLATGDARVEHFPVSSEAIEKVAGGADGSLYVPHIDGNKNFWAGCGYASREFVDGDWRWDETILPGQAIHVFDMIETDEGLWAAGSSVPDDQNSGTSAVWFRPAGGEWSIRYRGVDDHGVRGGQRRFLYLATDGHVVRCEESGSSDALELTASSTMKLPRSPYRYGFADGEWVTYDRHQRVIDGRLCQRPEFVPQSRAWTIHGGAVYYSAGNGGINREEIS